MAWLELHQSLRNHPKLLHLKAILTSRGAIPAGLCAADAKDLVRAKLENLWLWALDYCLDGRLMVSDRPISAAEIADAAEWNGAITVPERSHNAPLVTVDSSETNDPPTVWLRSLIESKWIDEKPGGVGGKTLYLHDWEEYAGKLLEQREADRIRKADERSRRKSEGQRTDGGRTVPYRTVPYLKRGETPQTAVTQEPSTAPVLEQGTGGEDRKPPPPKAVTPAQGGKTASEDEQLSDTVIAFKSFTTPGTKTKRQYLGELRRLGIGHERLRQAAKDNPNCDFFDVYRGLKKTVAELPHVPRPAIEKPEVLKQPRDKAQQDLDLARIEIDTKIAELPPEEVAALTREIGEEAVAKNVFAGAREDWIASRLRTRVAEKFGIKTK